MESQNNLNNHYLRKVLTVFMFAFFCGVVYPSSVSRYPFYFDKTSYWMNICDYIVKGKIIDKKAVGYVEDGADNCVVAVKIAIIDSFNYDIGDTVWIYPDLELYFNRQKRIDVSNRDTVWSIQSEDVDHDSWVFINYDKYGNFKTGQLCFFRFRKEGDAYIYSLADMYLPVLVVNNKVNVKMNRWITFTDIFKPLNQRNKVNVKRFERQIKKRFPLR